MPAVQVERLERRSADSPDETRTPPNATVQQVGIAGHTLGRMTMRPGWRWSEHIKPIAGTDSCQLSHIGYAVAGALTVSTSDGAQEEIRAGDFYSIPPGHDAWNAGGEDFVGIEIVSAGEWARS